MNDFLTRMARLSRGEITTVSPRLPGHFTPVTNTRAAEPADVGIVAQSREPHATPPGPAVQGATPEPQVQARVSETGNDDRQANRKIPETLLPPALPGDTDNGASHDFSPVSVRSSAPLAGSAPGKPRGTEEDRAAAQFSSAEVPAVRRRQQSPKPESTTEPHVSGDPLNHGRDRPVHRQLLIRAQPETPGETRLPDLLQPIPTRQDTKSNPDVHIHIGRIEVRVSTPAPREQPRPAPSQPQSSLSLQDYLARAHTGSKHS